MSAAGVDLLAVLDRHVGQCRNELDLLNAFIVSGDIVSYEKQLADLQRWHSEAETARAVAADLLLEMENIAKADPRRWDEEVRDQFQQWAQNRARHAHAKATGGAA